MGVMPIVIYHWIVVDLTQSTESIVLANQPVAGYHRSMSDSELNSGNFDGADAIIASFLGLRDHQNLKQQSVSRGLGDSSHADGDFLALVTSLYGRIESIYTSRKPSRENWRSKRVTTLSDHNTSPEVLLERAGRRPYFRHVLYLRRVRHGDRGGFVTRAANGRVRRLPGHKRVDRGRRNGRSCRIV